MVGFVWIKTRVVASPVTVHHILEPVSRLLKHFETNKQENMKRKPVIEPDNGFADHGGYMAAKVTKLEDQFNFIQAACKQKSKIFVSTLILMTYRSKAILFLFEGRNLNFREWPHKPVSG